MKNNLKKHAGWIAATAVITLIPLFVGLILWRRLPERMATHFNFAGEADGYSGKAFAVFFPPLFCLAMHVLVAVVCAIDPKNADGKAVGGKVYRILLFACPVGSVYCAYLIYGEALGLTMNVRTVSQLFLAVLFLALGNYIPKVRQNYTVGARLPWTLENPEVWAKTNRLSGWILVVSGIAYVFNAFLNVGGEAGFWALLIAQAAVLAVVPAVYSYVLWKKAGGGA